MKSFHVEDNRTSKLISLVADAKATGDNIDINPLRFRMSNTHFSGNIKGAFMDENSNGVPDFQVNILSSSFVAEDLVPYLPPDMYSSLNRIPPQMSLTGQFSSVNQFIHGDGKITSNQGDVNFNGELDQSNVKLPAYKINVGLDNVNAGFFPEIRIWVYSQPGCKLQAVDLIPIPCTPNWI